MASVLSGDPALFWRGEIQVREALSLPPFGEMLTIFVAKGVEGIPPQILQNHPDWWDNRKGWIARSGRRFGAVVLRGRPRIPESTFAAARDWVDRERGRVRLLHLPGGPDG